MVEALRVHVKQQQKGVGSTPAHLTSTRIAIASIKLETRRKEELADLEVHRKERALPELCQTGGNNVVWAQTGLWATKMPVLQTQPRGKGTAIMRKVVSNAHAGNEPPGGAGSNPAVCTKI